MYLFHVLVLKYLQIVHYIHIIYFTFLSYFIMLAISPDAPIECLKVLNCTCYQFLCTFRDFMFKLLLSCHLELVFYYLFDLTDNCYSYLVECRLELYPSLCTSYTQAVTICKTLLKPGND